MNSTIGVLVGVLVLGGILFAQSKIKKTPKGLEIVEVKTYYQNSIVWGDKYVDHDESTGVHNTEVVAYGDGWEYSTTTDDSGMFIVQVKPNSQFKLKASDGNVWANTQDFIEGVAEGTTFDDRTAE